MLNISLPYMHYDIGAALPSMGTAAAQMFMWGKKPSRCHGSVVSQTVLLKLSQCFGAGGLFLILLGHLDWVVMFSGSFPYHHFVGLL